MDVMRNNGNQVMKPAFIRFVNKTPYDVEIYCQIKSDDQERSFGCVAPNNYVDSNTYTTYQFVFRELASKYNMVVEGKKKYFPKPWVVESNRPKHSIGRLYRTIVIIQMPMLDLKQLSLMKIASLLKTTDDVMLLEIPNKFKEELKIMVLNKEKRVNFMDFLM